MTLLDLLGLGDLLISWRFHVGIAATALLCLAIVQWVPDESVAWVICIPLGIIGMILSFRWQLRADRSKSP
jgi:Flp pilus assembly protein TadB